MSGAGNTFIVIDSRELPAGTDPQAMAPAWCSTDLPHGGADGLIVVSGPVEPDADFNMLYYNRDGSSGMMCGNGSRCAVQFAAAHNHTGKSGGQIQFTNAGVRYQAVLTDRGVRVYFPPPRRFKLRFKLNLMGDMRTCHYADVGTPHAVLFVDELGDPRLKHVRQLDVDMWGAAVRNHPDFAPQGANANFAEVLPDNAGVLLRTFERGVEGETGACGTGAISAGILANVLRGVPAPVHITVTSGAELIVDFRVQKDGHVADVSLEGDAETLWQGTL